MPLRNILAASISKRRNIAALIAFLISPVLPAVVFAVSSPGLVSPSDAFGVAILSMVFYIYSCGFIAALALPLYLLALKFNVVRFWSALLAGAMGGAAVSLAVPVGMSQPYYEAAVREALPFYASLGAATGALFFLILIGANRLLRVNSRRAADGL
jgi:hypothetical protein